MRYRRSDLSGAMRRNIKRKEKDLDRRCGLIWAYTNPKGETYLFGRFNRGRGDHIVVTLGYQIYKDLSPGHPNAFFPAY